MVSRSEIAQLSKRIDSLVLALKPASELPPCPLIRLAINPRDGNTHAERQSIEAFLSDVPSAESGQSSRSP